MPNLTRSLSVAAIALAAVISVHATEAIYKWVDEEGVTHFSAQPPDGVDYEQVITRSGTTARRTEARTDSETATDEADAQSESDLRARIADLDALAEQCEQARTNLALLAEAGPVVLRDDDGNEVDLDSEARLSFADENQAFLDEWCD